MTRKKADVRALVERIASLARERMTSAHVIAIEDLKKLGPQPIPKTLLIIEDDESLRHALERIFVNDGYKLVLASGGTDLISILGDTAIDLILLDIGLPWIDGFELAEMIKAHRDLSKVPIVFMSGQNDRAVVKKGFAVGAHDFITKPFEIDVVKKTVRTLLELHS
jgi:two-component system, OmpR family, aerobic respiration control protein ArcA